MDSIIENLYGSLKVPFSHHKVPNGNFQDENALLVIVGDHGMTQQGSHGGASPEETKVPMVFVTTKFGIKGAQNGRKMRFLLRSFLAFPAVFRLKSIL